LHGQAGGIRAATEAKKGAVADVRRGDYRGLVLPLRVSQLVMVAGGFRGGGIAGGLTSTVRVPVAGE
jgi:hypothetical protein